MRFRFKIKLLCFQKRRIIPVVVRWSKKARVKATIAYYYYLYGIREELKYTTYRRIIHSLAPLTAELDKNGMCVYSEHHLAGNNIWSAREKSFECG